jgi:hypothetical protein
VQHTQQQQPAAMGQEDKKLAVDAFAWFLNVSTSVVIVFVNKVLMDDKKGYRFVFGARPAPAGAPGAPHVPRCPRGARD